MTELNKIILAEAREEVAKESGYADYFQIDMTDLEPSERTDLKLSVLENAALLALEKQADFYRWASVEYLFNKRIGKWIHMLDIEDKGPITELELYQLFKTPSGE